MSAEEELKMLKSQALKKARIQSVVLGFAAVVAVLFMVYGFTQNIEATRQKDLATFEIEKAKKEASVLREQLIKCESEKTNRKQ